MTSCLEKCDFTYKINDIYTRLEYLFRHVELLIEKKRVYIFRQQGIHDAKKIILWIKKKQK